MNKIRLILWVLPFFGSLALGNAGYYGTNYVLSAPAAGEPGTTAVHMSSNAIVAWADGYTDLVYGSDVEASWRVPSLALGPAQGSAVDVLPLGRGGQITLTFSVPIGNGAGADFVIFENSFDGKFLELAYVEVSSDGTNFVRFPNYSYAESTVPAFGEIYPQLVYGVASKYELEYGTPFDLSELSVAYDAQLAGLTDFSTSFGNILTNAYPLLDLNHITHIRLIDIVGDGASLDARGQPIYDPYPTSLSAGFDLGAVGIINAGALNPMPGPEIKVVSADAYLTLSYAYDITSLSNGTVTTSTNLLSWTEATPEFTWQSTNGTLLSVTNQYTLDSAAYRYYRLEF